MGALGSRGGKIIGYFKSGRPMYQSYKETLKGVIRGVKRVDPAEIAIPTANAGLGGVYGAIAGSTVGGVYQTVALRKLGPKLDKELKGPKQVDSRATVRGLKEFSKVEVITSRADLEANKNLTNVEKSLAIKGKKLRYEIETFASGSNAAAYKSPETGKEFIFASKSVNKQVLGHELGHIKDYREGKIDKSTSSVFGVIKGKQYAAESRAWDKSPFKGKEDEPLKTDALQTYKINRRAHRTMAAFSVAGAATWAIVARKR